MDGHQFTKHGTPASADSEGYFDKSQHPSDEQLSFGGEETTKLTASLDEQGRDRTSFAGFTELGSMALLVCPIML